MMPMFMIIIACFKINIFNLQDSLDNTLNSKFDNRSMHSNRLKLIKKMLWSIG